MAHRKAGPLALALAVAFLTACAEPGPRPPAYGWANYEGLIYDMYAQPGEATPEAQVAQLSAGLEEVENAGRQAGPGVYAHLGYMQYLTGNFNAARDAFERERSLYPESAAFMDGLLKQLGEG